MRDKQVLQEDNITAAEGVIHPPFHLAMLLVVVKAGQFAERGQQSSGKDGLQVAILPTGDFCVGNAW